MKLGVLFSGGKDSAYAMHIAAKEHEIACLVSIHSDNPESYMFHTPNIELTHLQAESLGLPLIVAKTKGEKEKELVDLKQAIAKAKEVFRIEGIVTGAVKSVYQASRIQKICDELKIECINPLWEKDQVELLEELLENNFEVVIVGVFGYPLDETWLGRKIDSKVIEELSVLQEKYKINPSGEGGEIETFVVNASMFKRPIEIIKASKTYSKNAGVYRIEDAKLQ
jgi:diphthine-ammonia ligase